MSEYEIYFNPSLPTFPMSGGTITLLVTFIRHDERFNFTENTSRPSWLMTEETGRVTSGDTTTVTYEVTAEPYEGAEERTDILTFEIAYSDGEDEEFFDEVIEVRQLAEQGGLDGELLFTKTSSGDYFNEDTCTVEIPANLVGTNLHTGCKIMADPDGSVWKIEIDNPETWVSVFTDSLNNVKMTVTESTEHSPRTAQCTVTAYLVNTETEEQTDVTKEYILSVRQEGIDYTLSVEPEETEIRYRKQRVRVNIKKSGNIFDLSVTDYPDYVSIVTLTETYAIVEFGRNETDEERTATFTFYGVNSDNQIVWTQCAITQRAYTSETLTIYGGNEHAIQSGTGHTDLVTSFDIDNIEVTVLDGSSWLTVADTDYDGNIGYFEYTYTANETASRRSAIIQVTAYDEDENSITETTKIYQAAAPAYTEYPVWIDQYLTVRNSEYEGEYIQYRISVNNERDVYFGRMYIDRGQEYTRARLNGIFSNYISEQIDFTESLTLQDNRAHVNFYVYVSTDDWATSRLYGLYREYYDYTYKAQYPNVLSAPVRYTLDSRQRFLFSVRNYYSDGIGNQLRIFVNNYGQAPVVESFENGTYTYLINNLTGIHDLYVELATGEQRHYTVSQDCRHRYCLYYRNESGGYDSILFDGREVRKEKIESKTYGRAFDNTTLERQTVDYEKVITDSWELTTGYLNNQEALRVAQILHSTDVWLQDMENGRDVIPVRITDNTYEEKTWRNTKKPFLYTIKIESARNKWLK